MAAALAFSAPASATQSAQGFTVEDFAAQRVVSRTYHTGPRGGCYYINSKGNKTYVDHSFCR